MEGIPNTNTIINHAFSNYNDKLDLVQKGSKVALAALIILGPGILILAATLISDAVNDLFDFIHPSTSEEKQAPKRNISSPTNLGKVDKDTQQNTDQGSRDNYAEFDSLFNAFMKT